jgi:nicotinate-nucleotide pyrophosphorylase
VEALSEAHAERGRLERAIRVRVEGAKALQRAGRMRKERILLDNERLKQLQKSQIQERIDG